MKRFKYLQKSKAFKPFYCVFLCSIPKLFHKDKVIEPMKLTQPNFLCVSGNFSDEKRGY